MLDIFIMNMGGHDDNVIKLTTQFPHAKVIRWTTHDNCMRKAAQLSRTNGFWLIASCCDYTDFDFDWRPVPWESEFIHCWASGKQKQGDTFWMPKQVAQYQGELKDFEWIFWHPEPRYRLDVPVYQYSNQDIMKHLDVVCATPYGIWSSDHKVQYDLCLWDQPKITSLNRSNSITAIPRQSLSHLRTQIYDYPTLDYKNEFETPPMDVVFVDNGEPCAEENWVALQESLLDHENEIHRVSGVNGRVNAYHECARQSKTPWYFWVSAKLRVHKMFDWSWQPDYWQRPKHYIFHANNKTTGLKYGHMALICYFKRHVLANTGVGLDFTLDSPHEVVPIDSGTANYTYSELSAWRTAFRETIKLCDAQAKQPSFDCEHRLNAWLNKGEGINGHWSILGARDAEQYYNKVSGDFDRLKLSYDWKWLKSHYESLHGPVPVSQ